MKRPAKRDVVIIIFVRYKPVKRFWGFISWFLNIISIVPEISRKTKKAGTGRHKDNPLINRLIYLYVTFKVMGTLNALDTIQFAFAPSAICLNLASSTPAITEPFSSR